MTARRTNEHIFDRLGALGATVGDLGKGVDALRQSMEKRDDKIEAELRAINSRLDEMEEVAVSAKKTAESAKAVTDKLDRWVQQGRGAFVVLTLLGVTASGVAFYFMEKLNALAAWLRSL